MQMVKDMRKADIKARTLKNIKLWQERQEAINKENERLKERDAFVEEERVKWDEDQMQKKLEDDEKIKLLLESKAKAAEESEEDEEEEEEKVEIKPYEIVWFDPKDSIAKFDEENPPIVIPPEVINDIDNDLELTPEDLKAEND